MCMGFTRTKAIPEIYICQKCRWDEESHVIESLCKRRKFIDLNQDTDTIVMSCEQDLYLDRKRPFSELVELENTSEEGEKKKKEEIEDSSPTLKRKRESEESCSMHVCHLCHIICDSVIGVPLARHFLLCHLDVRCEVFRWEGVEVLVFQTESSDGFDTFLVCSLSLQPPDLVVTLNSRLQNDSVFLWKGTPFPYRSLLSEASEGCGQRGIRIKRDLWGGGAMEVSFQIKERTRNFDKKREVENELEMKM